MGIKDLAGISQPLEKLISSVSDAIGVIYEPTRIRRKAKADAEANLIQNSASLEISKTNDQYQEELAKRATRRIAFQELKAQQNIDNIMAVACENVVETADDNQADTDWVSAFFDECKSVSDDNLQEIWGKILAGEVSKPGSYSRITLSVLKNISKSDALLFEKLASLTWEIIGGQQTVPYSFIPIEFDREPMPLDVCGINHDQCIHLSNLGLLNVSKDLFLQVIEDSRASYFHNQYNVYLSLPDFPVNGGNLNIYSYSKAAIELLPLVKREYNEKWHSISLERMTRVLNADFVKFNL